MTQNSAPLPDPQDRDNQKSRWHQWFWLWASGGSLLLHTAFILLFFFWPKTPIPPAETLMIVDLQQEKPKEQPKPTAQPTPEPTKAEPTPTPPRVAQIPTPVPTPKQVEKKAEPKPIPPAAKPTPAKKAVAVKPQPTAMPTPEANEGKKTKPVATPKNVKTTPQKPETKPEKNLGRLALNKTGDGAPKAPAKPKFDEEAGALSGNLKPGEGRNDPNTRKKLSRGSSPFDDPFNKPETGGQNDKPQIPLPQGLQTGRPDANRNDLAPGKLASNLRGLGRPGGGSSGNFSPNPGSGSPNGVNPELAGSDAGGGANLPRKLARRGGGGGPDAFFPVLNHKSDLAVAVDSGAPGLSPGLAGGQGGGSGGGTGSNSGKGIGTRLAGVDRGALNTKVGPGIGGGNGAGVGGPRGSGNGGEIAGGGGGSGGGFGGGQGSGYGAGKGGFGGGNGRGRGRVSGDPFGDPNGSRGGNSNGGGGTGGGPGGPGKGPLLAMRGGGAPSGSWSGDGKGDGAGRGPGGRGAGGGFGPGRGAGGFGKGPGIGGGNGSGEGGKGIGGAPSGSGNGDGPAGGGDAGRGDGEAGDGSGIKGRPYRVRPGAQREIEGENSIGRGIWAPGFQIEFYQDTANHPDMPDATFHPGNPIDWKPFTQLVARKTVPILNFNWGTDPPAKGMTYTFWSMKATGRIFVPKDDTYEFYFDELDDAGRLYLDGKKIIDIWWVQKSTPASKGYFLKKGPHDLMIEYVQGPATEASIKLSWKSTSFPKEIIGVYKPND